MFTWIQNRVIRLMDDPQIVGYWPIFHYFIGNSIVSVTWTSPQLDRRLSKTLPIVVNHRYTVQFVRFRTAWFDRTFTPKLRPDFKTLELAATRHFSEDPSLHILKSRVNKYFRFQVYTTSPISNSNSSSTTSTSSNLGERFEASELCSRRMFNNHLKNYFQDKTVKHLTPWLVTFCNETN